MIDPEDIHVGDKIWVEVTHQPKYGLDCFYPRYNNGLDTLPKCSMSKYCQVCVRGINARSVFVDGYDPDSPASWWGASIRLLETAYWNDPTPQPERKYSIIDRFREIGEELG